MLAIIVNISCNYEFATHSKFLEDIVECILEVIYKWQNEDSETAIVGVMNLINLCERKYPFTADHIDTLLEVKNTCTLKGDEMEKILGF